MNPLIVVPFSRPERAANVAWTLASQLEHTPAVVVENGAALGALMPGPLHDVIASAPSAGAARNAGLAYARERGHDWIIFLDDDDYYGPGYARVAQWYAASGDADAYHQGMGFVRFPEGLLLFGGEALSYDHVIGNSLVVHVDMAPDFPEISGNGGIAWSQAFAGRVGLMSPWHHAYNRTGGNAWTTTRAQMLRTYGGARDLGDLPDSFVDAPGSCDFPRVLSPDDDAIFRDLECVSRRRLHVARW